MNWVKEMKKHLKKPMSNQEIDTVINRLCLSLNIIPPPVLEELMKEAKLVCQEVNLPDKFDGECGTFSDPKCYACRPYR